MEVASNSLFALNFRFCWGSFSMGKYVFAIYRQVYSNFITNYLATGIKHYCGEFMTFKMEFSLLPTLILKFNKAGLKPQSILPVRRITMFKVCLNIPRYIRAPLSFYFYRLGRIFFRIYLFFFRSMDLINGFLGILLKFCPYPLICLHWNLCHHP